MGPAGSGVKDADARSTPGDALLLEEAVRVTEEEIEEVRVPVALGVRVALLLAASVEDRVCVAEGLGIIDRVPVGVVDGLTGVPEGVGVIDRDMPGLTEAVADLENVGLIEGVPVAVMLLEVLGEGLVVLVAVALAEGVTTPDAVELRVDDGLLETKRLGVGDPDVEGERDRVPAALHLPYAGLHPVPQYAYERRNTEIRIN